MPSKTQWNETFKLDGSVYLKYVSIFFSQIPHFIRVYTNMVFNVKYHVIEAIQVSLTNSLWAALLNRVLIIIRKYFKTTTKSLLIFNVNLCHLREFIYHGKKKSIPSYSIYFERPPNIKMLKLKKLWTL